MRRSGPGFLWGVVGGLAGLVVLVAAFGLALTDSGLAQIRAQRISFQIATGSTSGKYFPVGETLAGLISHPPGITRCERDDVCGPSGLIVSARASEGSVANVLAVEHGRVESALAQADVVALAERGKGPFRQTGRVRRVRVIANLYPEDVHLVASTKSRISSVADLKGKRVSLSTQGSGTIATAQSVLAAYKLSEKSMRASHLSVDKAAQLLQAGKLDAFFFVGGAPVRLIDSLIVNRAAVLVPINGEGRKRLLSENPSFTATTIARRTYADTPATDTVSVGALWITNSSQPDDLIYAMVKALYNRANRKMLDESRAGNKFVQLDFAAKGAAAPFHNGAARYFKEAGVLEQAALPVPVRKP